MSDRWCRIVGTLVVVLAFVLLLGLAMAASAWLGDVVAGLR